MDQIPELKKQVPLNFVSIAAIIAAVVIAFYAGSISERASMQDDHHTKEIENVKQMINDYHQFALDEVSGVRSDMNREVEQLENKLDHIKNEHGK